MTQILENKWQVLEVVYVPMSANLEHIKAHLENGF